MSTHLDDSPGVPAFGQLSVRAPAIGPFILAADGNRLDVRLGFEPGLGEPLLAGALPAARLGSAQAVDSACFALWPGPSSLQPDNRAAVFGLDLGIFPDEEPLLVFVLHGQPPGFETLIGPGLAPLERVSMGLRIEEAAHQWWQANGIQAPTAAMIAALVDAQRRAFAQVHSPRELAGLQRATARPTSKSLDLQHRRVCFAVTCCRYPAGMFDRAPAGLAPSPSDRSLAAFHRQRRAREAAGEATPEFALMLGDQIYVDATAGVFDPALSDDRYAAPYRQWLTNPMVQQALDGLPLHAMPDDHELFDNWGPVDPQAGGIDTAGQPVSVPAYIDKVRREGLLAYAAYQGPRQVRSLLPAAQGHLYRQAGPPDLPSLVFMADTRTERTGRQAGNLDEARLVSDGQWGALREWLFESQGAGPRFLACPSMVLPRRRAACGPTLASALRSDAWDGYPRSLLALLAVIGELRLDNLVLLSGDEHLASVSEIRLIDRGPGGTAASPVETVLHAIHAPALYAPYPFANARPDDFSQASFGFEPGRVAYLPPDPADGTPPPRYRCEVRSWFPSRADGFLWIDTPVTERPARGLKLMLSFPEASQVAPLPDWLKNSPRLKVEVLTGTAAPARVP